MPGTLSTSKVSATLRRAHYRAAKWIPSGQVRGWGQWSPGFKLQKLPEGIHVTHKQGLHVKQDDSLFRYAHALSHHYTLTQTDDTLLVTGFKH